MFIAIEDVNDPRVAMFRLSERGLTTRPQRRAEPNSSEGDGMFMAEGDLVVERALDAGCRPIAALVDADRPPAVAAHLAGVVPVFSGGAGVRAQVLQLGLPQPIVALFQRPPRATPDQLIGACTRLVVLEAVDNPSNVGSIVRNALALGWDGLLLDDTSADPLARRALRVSMGQALHLPFARSDDLPGAILAMRAAGIRVLALTPAIDADELSTVDVPERVAVMIGAERDGLSAAALDAADQRVRIALDNGVDSLNAAAASAIALHALRRPRPCPV